jgi:hypothetical protein
MATSRACCRDCASGPSGGDSDTVELAARNENFHAPSALLPLAPRFQGGKCFAAAYCSLPKRYRSEAPYIRGSPQIEEEKPMES